LALAVQQSLFEAGGGAPMAESALWIDALTEAFRVLGDVPHIYRALFVRQEAWDSLLNKPTDLQNAVAAFGE
jgi:hypothetical protein